MTHRREFLGYLSLTGLLALSTGTASAQRQLSPDDYNAVPTWIGPNTEKPDPQESPNNQGEALYISEDTGEITHLDFTNGTENQLETRLKPIANSDLPDPTTVPEGYIVHDQDRGTPAWNDGTGFEFPSFIDDVKTTATTVSNTSTRTEVFNPDINAMSLIEGRDYELTVSGKFSTANNSDTFDVIVDLGGTDVATLTNAGKNVTDAHWRSVTEFSVRPGSGGDVHLAPESYGQFDEQMRGAVHDVVSVDPTVLTNISVDILWSAAAAGNSVTVERGTLQQRG